MSREKILDTIDMLPINYLLLFAEYIMESLSPNDSDIQETWEDEVQRHMDNVDQGSCELIPSEDLHNDLYRLFNDKKQELLNNRPQVKGLLPYKRSSKR